jgi:hypothetical protein
METQDRPDEQSPAEPEAPIAPSEPEAPDPDETGEGEVPDPETDTATEGSGAFFRQIRKQSPRPPISLAPVR